MPKTRDEMIPILFDIANHVTVLTIEHGLEIPSPEKRIAFFHALGDLFDVQTRRTN